MEKTDIRSLSFSELEHLILEMGERPFRAGQIYGWLHQKTVTDFEQMGNLPKQLRKRLSESCNLTVLKPVQVKVSSIDKTRKYLFQLADGNVIESVWMQYHHGCSVCISSQVGCRMGCKFCASTLEGLERDLTAAEMLEQVYRIQALSEERISHIVLMGSGEPFDNYENVVRFLRLVSDERGFHISLRNITVSTCGIVPGIRRFAEEGLPVTLALSLHAPKDKVRRELMPVAKSYPLDEVLDACREYFTKTGRRLTFEYSLVKNVNDNPGEAMALARLLKGMHGHVNLIPVNPVSERNFVRSDKRAILEFQRILEQAGIAVTVRREMGRDIQGACGQLRRSFLEKKEQGSIDPGKENKGG